MNFLVEVHDRTQDSSAAGVNILESEHRRQTDLRFWFIIIACIAITLPFLIYTQWNSDINRLVGYDECGDVCGKKNIKNERFGCSGKDMTHKPVLNNDLRICEEIDNYTESHYAGFRGLGRLVWKLLLLTLLPLSLCFILVVLFQYVPALAVWGTVTSRWIIFTAAVIFLPFWIGNIESAVGGKVVIIFLCISTIPLSIWIIFNVNKMRSTTIIIKEASRAVFEVKIVSYVAIAALVLLAAMLPIFSTIGFRISTAGKLEETEEGHLAYVKNNAMIIGTVLYSISVIWSIQFVFGAHYMIVSGAVARWYTSKNQDGIHDSVIKSSNVTLKYHLGTVALGSVLITIMTLPRGILQFLSKFSGFKERADSWLKCLDGYFSTNTYIVTAMYATSFILSGKKAAQILKLSIGNTMDLNNFTNFVINAGQSLVVLVSTLVTFVTLYDRRVYNILSIHFTLIAFVFANFCAHTFLGTLQASANTLFLCASEQLMKNMEPDFPYTMTMAKFTGGTNKLLLQKLQNRPPSNIIEKKFYIKLFLFIFVSVSFIVCLVAIFV